MEVVGEHGGGFAPGSFDERGALPGDDGGCGGERGGVLVGGGQDVEEVANERLVDPFELAARDLVAGEDPLELAVDGGDGVTVGRVGSEGGDIEKAVLEGGLHAVGGDGFGGASQLVDDVAVVVLQQVHEGVAAGQEHVDVGADAVLPAGREDRPAAEVRRNARAEHLGPYRVNDAALRGPQAGRGFGKRQDVHGLSGARRRCRESVDLANPQWRHDALAPGGSGELPPSERALRVGVDELLEGGLVDEHGG